MKHIQQAFEELFAKAYPHGTPTGQREELRKMFFAGVSFATTSLVEKANDADSNEDQAVAYASSLIDELQEFANELRSRSNARRN